jgi:hypothetical protein
VVDGCKLTDLGREFLAFISGPEIGTADPDEGAE